MRVGDIIEYRDGSRYEVLLVNFSRAHLRAMTREQRNGMAYNPKTGKNDKPFSFKAPPAETDISPNAEVKIVGNTGREAEPRVVIGGFVFPAGYGLSRDETRRQAEEERKQHEHKLRGITKLAKATKKTRKVKRK